VTLTEAHEMPPSDNRPLDDRVAEIVGLLNVTAAELVKLIGEALRTGAWQGFGIRSPEHWVVWRCGVSPARARRLVATALALEVLPRTTELFETGALGEDQTAVVIRHTDAEHDEQVAELAPSLTVPQLQRVLPSVPRTKSADPDAGYDSDDTSTGTPDAPPAHRAHRGVRFGHGEDGNWWCSIHLPGDEGALVQRALEAGRHTEFRLRYPDDADDRSIEASKITWADGLLRFAEAGLTVLDPATAAGRPPADRTQVILHLDADGPTPPRLHLGPVLPPGVADYLSCDSTVRYLMLRAGNPVTMGRRERTVNPRLRTVIEHRDGGCRVPGCDYARWLHVHHLQHWTKGGRTDPDNLCALCPVHHRMVHTGLLTIWGDPTDPSDPDGLTFTDGQGRKLEPAHPRPPGLGVSPADAAKNSGLPPPDWQHPPGEPLDTRWITWD
jgi:hypothetical protein